MQLERPRSFRLTRALLLTLAAAMMMGCGATQLLSGATPTPTVDVEATQDALDATSSALDARSTEQAEAEATTTAIAEATAGAEADATATAQAYTLSAFVVSDGIVPGTDRFSSGDQIAGVLEDLGYRVEYWSTLDDGVPFPRFLDQYDVVYWSVGNDCCDTPAGPITEILMEYLDNKGQLVIDGGSIAKGYMNSTFLQEYLGADFGDFGNMIDVGLADNGHPLNAGLNGPLRLIEAPFPPDVINPSPGVGAEPFWVRGPNSAQAGQPVALAYDDGDRRVIYVSFPLYLLQRQDLRTFLSNAMEWFQPRELGEPTA